MGRFSGSVPRIALAPIILPCSYRAFVASLISPRCLFVLCKCNAAGQLKGKNLPGDVYTVVVRSACSSFVANPSKEQPYFTMESILEFSRPNHPHAYGPSSFCTLIVSIKF